MQNLNFTELDKLNLFLLVPLRGCEDLKVSPPSGILVSLMQAVENNNKLINANQTPESKDFFLKLVKKIWVYIEQSRHEYIKQHRPAFSLVIQRIKQIIAESPVSKPMTVAEHNLRCLMQQQEKNERLLDFFISMNPAQRQEISKSFDDADENLLEALRKGRAEFLFNPFFFTVLEGSPFHQFYIARRFIQIGKFDKSNIDALCQSIDSLFSHSMAAPFERFCDALSEESDLNLLAGAVEATQHLDRETALSFIPFLLFGSPRHTQACLDNFANLKKSGLFDDFCLDKIQDFCLQILPIKNVFCGTREIDIEIMDFAISILPQIKFCKALNDFHLEIFQSILKLPQGKLLVLAHILFFLNQRPFVNITLEAFPEGTQDREDFYIAIDALGRRHSGFRPSAMSWLSKDQLVEITSNVTALNLGRNDKPELVQEILNKASKLEHLTIELAAPLEFYIDHLEHPEKILSLNLKKSTPQRVTTIKKLINLQNFNIEGNINHFSINNLLGYVTSIYEVDPVRGIRLAIQFNILESMIRSELPIYEMLVPHNLSQSLTIDSRNITEEHIPFIAEEKVKQHPLALVYTISLFARVKPHLKDVLEEILRLVLDGSSRNCFTSTCSMLLNTDFNSALEHWKENPPHVLTGPYPYIPRHLAQSEETRSWLIPVHLILDNPVLNDNYRLNPIINFIKNIPPIFSTDLHEMFYSIFSLNKDSIHFLNSSILLEGFYAHNLDVLINAGIKKFGLVCLLRIEKEKAIAFLKTSKGRKQLKERFKELFFSDLSDSLRPLFFEAYPVGDPDNAEIYSELDKFNSRFQHNIEDYEFDNERLLEIAPHLKSLSWEETPEFNAFTSQLLRSATQITELKFEDFLVSDIPEWHAKFGIERFLANPWKQLFIYYLSSMTCVGKNVQDWCSAVLSRIIFETQEDPTLLRELVKTNPSAVLELLKQPEIRCEEEKELKQQAIEELKTEIVKSTIFNRSRDLLMYAWLEQLIAPDDPFFEIIKQKVKQLDFLHLGIVFGTRKLIKMIVMVLSWPDFPLYSLMEEIDKKNYWYWNLTYERLMELLFQICQAKEQSLPATVELKKKIFAEILRHKTWLEQETIPPILQEMAIKVPINLLTLIEPHLNNFRNNITRRKLIRLFTMALKELFTGQPLEPELSHHYAHLALDLHVFDHDDALIPLMELLFQICQAKEQSQPATVELKKKIFEAILRHKTWLEQDTIPPILQEMAVKVPIILLPLIEPHLNNFRDEINRPKLLRLLTMGLKALFNGQPLEPTQSHHYAKLALNLHIFDHDEAMFALMISLADNDPLLSMRPYQVYQSHQTAQQVPTQVIPPYFDITGIRAALSLEGLQDASKAMTVHKSELPPQATGMNWITLRDGLKQRIEQSEFLKKKYSDFSYIWMQCLRLKMYEDLLDFSVDGDLIPPTKAQWAAIVNYLLSLNAIPVDENHLSAQQKQLYHYAFALTACISGSRQGIAMLYSKIPDKFKYAAKGLEIGTEEQMRAKFQLMPLIARSLQSFLTQDERMLSEIVRLDRGKSYFADVHDIDYIKNSVEWLLGLGKFIVFDWHARGIMTLSRDQILEIVLKHLNPMLFVNALIEASIVPEKSKWTFGEEPLGVLMGECISRSAAFWEFDAEGTSRLNERGALELLKFLGIVVLDEPAIITDWIKELSFVTHSVESELDHHQNCITLHRKLRDSYEKKTATRYARSLFHVIRAKLVEAHPLSILILNEQKHNLYNLLAPKEDRKTEFEDLLRDRINFVTIEMLDKIVEGPALMDTLRLQDSFKYVLTAATRELFAEKLGSQQFQERRWNSFREKLSVYNLYLKESRTFEIPVFQIFCHEANVLLPPGELSLCKGYERVKRRLERVIDRIKTRAKATHILTLQEVKKAYDPLAERLGQHPMEFEMKQS